MTIYYVRTTGDDGAAGTSPATAWLTIGKALGAAGISSGDTVYIGAGVYREKATCALTSPTVETFVIGDVDGSRTGDAGEIRITNYLTNDKTAPTEQGLLDLNGRSHLTFEQITFHFACTTGIPAVAVNAAAATSQYLVFRDCYFHLMDLAETAFFLSFANNDSGNLPFHALIDRCAFFAMDGGAFIYILRTLAPVSEYDLDFVVQNCLFIGADMQAALDSDLIGDTGSGFAGGIVMRNCTCIGDLDLLFINQQFSTTFPASASGCLVAVDWHVPIETTFDLAGQILEDYNIFFCKKPPTATNVTSGGHSIQGVQYAPLFHFGQELMQGLLPRPFGMPTADSPLLGFGDDGNAPSVDILNRRRPAGGQSTLKAIGAHERHDTGAKEVTVVDSAPASVKIIGPGDHDFYIPVDAIATTISIKARYDTNHAATNKPQVILLAAPEIGVTAETKTMTVAANTWETLTFAAQTPTAKGVVKLRLVSRSAAGNGIAYFDTVSIA